jgi:predicted MFS family arabinose efflux permease
MNKLEMRTAFSLSAVFAVRMLGLFMILPILPFFAKNLTHATPFLIGLAIGIYGLTQALLQIPLGMLSDRIGRKPVIIGGLLVFAIGSILAALTDDIYIILIARAIQGSGAIAATTMALAADLSREDHRAKVMAFIGMSIGISFALAMVLGPAISQWAGLSGVFWMTALLAVIGIMLIIFVVPTPEKSHIHRDAGIITDYIKPVLKEGTLLRMNASVFLLHLLMTATFITMPLILRDNMRLENIIEHSYIYLPILFISFIFSLPLIIIAEKYRKIKVIFVIAVTLLIISQVLMGFSQYSFFWLMFSFLLFFIGFNFLEAVQPSLVAKYSDVNTKGTAMGVYSSAQFFGSFIGGTFGGLALQYWGVTGIFIFGVIAASLLLIVAISLPKPDFFKSQVIKLKDKYLENTRESTAQLLAIKGVKQASISIDEGVAYIKIDKLEIDEDSLKAFIY